MLPNLIFLVMFNQFIVNGLLVYVSILLDNYDVQIDMSTTVYPGRGTVLTHMLFLMLCEDFTFYFAHRLLHWGPLYRAVHKVHHRYKQPVGIVAVYAHPFETVLNVIAFSSG